MTTHFAQVLNFVRVAVQARKVNLLSLDEDLADTQILNVPIDSNLQEITVSVSGENPKIFLKDPSGNVPVFRKNFEFFIILEYNTCSLFISFLCNLFKHK